MKWSLLAASAVVLLVSPALAQQQIDFSKVEVKTIDLGSRTYMLEGAGGNVTIAVGDDAIIMVDSQFAPMHDKLKAAIEKISNLPIRYVVNTHFHGDHVGGDGGFRKDGATVLAHENVRSRLLAGTVNGLTGAKAPPLGEDAVPNKTYKASTTVKVKGLTAQVGHPTHAHTDGDTYVWFKSRNVLSTGDIVSRGNRYPNIDFANGGNIRGMISAVDKYIKMSNDQTKIVPGHGAVLTRAELIEYRRMLGTARQRVADLIKQGKSEKDAVAANPLKDIGAKLGTSDEQNTNFVRVIYNSLKPQKMAAN
jgi:glyoxylase-like metal-dependent hydrolase (beta-lactamase superfamily II)